MLGRLEHLAGTTATGSRANRGSDGGGGGEGGGDTKEIYAGEETPTEATVFGAVIRACHELMVCRPSVIEEMVHSGMWMRVLDLVVTTRHDPTRGPFCLELLRTVCRAAAIAEEASGGHAGSSEHVGWSLWQAIGADDGARLLKDCLSPFMKGPFDEEGDDEGTRGGGQGSVVRVVRATAATASVAVDVLRQLVRVVEARDQHSVVAAQVPQLVALAQAGLVKNAADLGLAQLLLDMVNTSPEAATTNPGASGSGTRASGLGATGGACGDTGRSTALVSRHPPAYGAMAVQAAMVLKWMAAEPVQGSKVTAMLEASGGAGAGGWRASSSQSLDLFMASPNGGAGGGGGAAGGGMITG